MPKLDQSEIQIRFWPFSVCAKGDRAIAALKWPLAVVMISVAVAVVVVVV